MLQSVDERRLRTVRQTLQRRAQTVPTSSCGRLFDAVSALLGVCPDNRYEAQAAMELECAASAASLDVESLGFELGRGEIDFRQTVRDIVAAQPAGVPLPLISARFHVTLARAIAACTSVRASDRIGTVSLSGGSFQNTLLLERTIAELERAGFAVFWQSEVPANDRGLSLGQALIANARIERGEI